MRKLKRIYICDHCGAIAIPKVDYFEGYIFKSKPRGWTKLGKEDLCPECSLIYEKFKKEVEGEKKEFFEDLSEMMPNAAREKINMNPINESDDDDYYF